ncbi:MAG: hypothetical protein ACOX56_05605 [Acholeplasmataceae bacterium]|jgi:phosphotransferase system IIB component
MYNLDFINPLTLALIIIGLVTLLAIIILIVLLIVKKTRSKSKLQSQNELAENIISALGGIENIKETSLSRRRFNVIVYDLNLLQPKEMRNLKLGAVITKNNVKMLVKDSPKEVYKYINRKKKEGK